MSNWVSVVGVIHVDTCDEMSREGLKRSVELDLKKAPKITGSEGNADIIVNIDKGYNVYTHIKEKPYEFQTCVTITIVGDLRDREINQTREEIKEFMKFIYKTFPIVRNGVVRFTQNEQGVDVLCRDFTGMGETQYYNAIGDIKE